MCSATVCYANFGVNCTKMRNILLKSVHSSDGHQCVCVIFCQMLFYYCSLIPNHLLPSYFVMVCILPGTSFLLHWLLSSALCISVARAKGWQYPEHGIWAEKQMSSRSLKEENGTDTPVGSKNKVDNKKIKSELNAQGLAVVIPTQTEHAMLWQASCNLHHLVA